MSVNKIFKKIFKLDSEKEDLENVQKEIEITEENVDAYKEFLRLTNQPAGIIPFASKREEIILIMLIMASTALPLIVVVILATIFPQNYILGIISIIGVFPAIGINCHISKKIIHKINMKSFQKQYPNFDMTSVVNEVAKELEKYKELSKVPKKIEEKKEEHLNNFQNNFKEMSTKEKINFLNQEREFWEQVAIQEKYENLEEPGGIRRVLAKEENTQ